MTIVMTEKLSDYMVIVASSISTIKTVLVKIERKKYVNICWLPSPTTLGTFGTQLDIH